VVRNVTSHKLTENAFEGKEAQLDNLLANVDAIILEGDPINIYYIGGQVERILGYPKEDWFEHPNGAVGFWSSLLHPDDTDKMEQCKQSIERGEDHAFEYRLRASDGRFIWFYDSVTVEVENDKPVKTHSIMVDITERKRAEEAVQESEVKYRTFFENSADAMLIIRGYKFMDCNAATVAMLGYDSKEEILDTHPSELSPEFQPDGKRSFEKEVELMEIALTKGTHRFEWDHQRKNGEVFPVEVSLTAITQDDETILHTVWLDITEHKRAEEALRRSEATGQALLDAPTDVAILVELDGTIVALNDAAASGFGQDSEQLVGVCAFDLLPPHLAKSRKAQGDLVARTGKPVSFEDERHGRVFANRLYPVTDSKGAVVRLAIFAQDRTEARQAEEERQKLEAQLGQAQKMEAIGRLAGGVAHDFNNLLQAILGYGDLALDEADAKSPLREPIEEILKAGNRAKSLVAQLLAFSRRQVLEMKDIDLNEVVTNLTKMIQRVIGEHISLDVITGHNLGFVRADPGRIEQILVNLCVNARDAMPTGGTITVETENVRIDNDYCNAHTWAKPGRYTLLSVTDTGCGMDEETLANIFDPFFTTKDVGEGTGLGLAPVYGLVKQHEGLLHVYSELDKGTTFKIYLPIVERSAEGVGTKIEGPPPTGTETILLAEDDEMVRELSQKILEQSGYTVIPVTNGEEALHLIEKHDGEIDLALLDVMMPKIGGKAVFDHIQKTHPKTRVLFSSGYSMNAIHTDFVLDEGLALIQKPYQRNDLLRRVREVLDS